MANGFKVFSVGEVLTAADVNDYLMEQSIGIFADSTARDAQITSPIEGQFCYLADSNVLQFYNGSSWTSFIGEGDITGVTITTNATGGLSGGATASSGAFSSTLTFTPNGLNAGVVSVANDSFVIIDADDSNNPKKESIADFVSAIAGTNLTASSGQLNATGGGLVYINSGTFSSVSTLTVSNVFSSTYQNYKIIIEITDNSNDNCGTTFRLYDGSEITANYISQRFQGEDSTAEVVKSPDGTDEWTCVPIDQTYAYGGFIQVLLNSPQQATATHFSLQGDGTFDSNTLYSTANSGVHTGTDQATGFAFKVSAGTFDGNWAVYGFAES